MQTGGGGGRAAGGGGWGTETGSGGGGEGGGQRRAHRLAVAQLLQLGHKKAVHVVHVRVEAPRELARGVEAVLAVADEALLAKVQPRGHQLHIPGDVQAHRARHYAVAVEYDAPIALRAPVRV